MPAIQPPPIISPSPMSMDTTTNSGCEKREANNNWSMVKPEKAAPFTGTTLRTTGPAPGGLSAVNSVEVVQRMVRRVVRKLSSDPGVVGTKNGPSGDTFDQPPGRVELGVSFPII